MSAGVSKNQVVPILLAKYKEMKDEMRFFCT